MLRNMRLGRFSFDDAMKHEKQTTRMRQREISGSDRLYVRLHNFLVYLFIQRFSQHVSVVYDHHEAIFTRTLTPVFVLFLPTLANVYILG
jgi:hypothetical protein